MSSAFLLRSRSDDLQVFHRIAYSAGMEAFRAAPPSTDDIELDAENAWSDARWQHGWQQDNPTLATYVDDLTYAHHVFVEHWRAGYRDAYRAWAEQHIHDHDR